MPKLEMIGLRFGRAIVVSETDPVIGADGRRLRHFLIRCDCGGEKIASRHELRAGDTQSCGCLFTEHAKRRKWSTHGEGGPKVRTPEYLAWSSMRSRCRNPDHKKYPEYGGRGITICERWDRFENFLSDMGRRPTPRHSLDRYPDNDGNYEPSNCRWATSSEQNLNRRKGRSR